MVKLIIVVLGIVCGVMAAWTGAGGGKYWRRLIVPAITAIFAMIVMRSWWAFQVLSRYFALQAGYGLPDSTDKGSAIAQFWVANLGKTSRAAIATRATIGVIESTTFMCIPFLSHTPGAWAMWGWAAVMVVGVNILFGAKIENEGHISFMGKKLLVEEIAIHGLDTIIIMGLAWLCR